MLSIADKSVIEINVKSFDSVMHLLNHCQEDSAFFMPTFDIETYLIFKDGSDEG